MTLHRVIATSVQAAAIILQRHCAAIVLLPRNDTACGIGAGNDFLIGDSWSTGALVIFATKIAASCVMRLSGGRRREPRPRQPALG